jgi:HlyD family secretion protein
MKFSFKLLLLTLALAVAALVFAFRPAAAPAAYRTAVVTRGDLAQTVGASGTLSAVTTVEVGTQVSGNIQKLLVDFNDTVAAGQLIAEIEPSTYEAALAQAESDLASARATLQLREVQARRARELSAQNLLAPADLDQTLAELAQQQAAVRNREAQYRTAEVNLARTRIYAPIDGTILSREVSTGQTVQANFSAPVLFKIAGDLRRMEISANVSEADIGSVEPGQPVVFTVDAFAGRVFSGEVRQVRNNPVTVQNVVTYATLIAVANDELRLRPGMTATVTITTTRRTGVLRAPDTALRFLPPADADLLPEKSAATSAPSAGFVRTAYLVSAPPDARGIAPGPLRPVSVVVGIGDGTFTEILSGLSEGDVVATARAAAARRPDSGPGLLPKPPAGGPPQI